ncbi:MAG: AAA family ATPase [Chloroflexi bacterium]|nr:AAA family ATPase [Chloroflexota bacterium]
MLWGLAGHDAAVQQLARAHAAGALAHGYLIAGPAGVGKTTLAVRLAQMVNCAQPDAPCMTCRSCRRIEDGKHPDVMTMTLGQPDLGYDPERPNERSLSIDRVRALEHAAALRPYEGVHRVFIIQGAHQLGREAQNALLKTLEEPPPSVLLLLLTAEEDALLTTIMSRVQRLPLGLVGKSVIAAHLRERFGLAPDQADRLGRLAQGRIGWAVRAAQDPSLLEERTAKLAALLTLTGATVDERFVWAAARAGEFSKNRTSVAADLDMVLDLWHTLLLLKAVGAEEVSDDALLPAMRQAVARLDLAALTDGMAAIRRAVLNLERNANPRLALEVLMLELPRPEGAGAAGGARGAR